MLSWKAFKKHLNLMLKNGLVEEDDEGQDICITEKGSKYVELMNSVRELFGDDGKEEGDEDENLESF
jgi:predicted transcriptional regulator